MDNVYAVIMAGGSGERFWPLSTRVRPKQFLSLFGGKPLLTQAAERLQGLIANDRIFVITAQALVEQSIRALPQIPSTHIIGEPCRRDTAAAVAVACGLVHQQHPDGIVCILTADQLMSDTATLHQVLRDSIATAQTRDTIVTIGIQPDHASTSFGYIEIGEEVETNTTTVFNKAQRFVEKPDAVTASHYLNSNRFYWNAGMFIWRGAVMHQEFQQQAPDLALLCQAVAQAGKPELIASVLEQHYPLLRSISIDYAIMERARNITVAQGNFGWDDVGSWSALKDHLAADESGNIMLGNCDYLSSHNNIVVSENRLTALIGVDNLVVAHSDKATLVCPVERASEIKELLRLVEKRHNSADYT